MGGKLRASFKGPRPVACLVSRVSHLLAMRVEAGVGEALALVLAEEAAVAEHNVIDFIARAFAIETMPFLRRLLSLSATRCG